MNLDTLIVQFDRALRTLSGNAQTTRNTPGADLPNSPLSATERLEAGRLMRVNHTGEVCAQALYQGQSLTARSRQVAETLEHAAREEADHLAWCGERLYELNTRVSLLNPLWYGGSFALGSFAGLFGDRWSLGFLQETERQVESHLTQHLKRLPAGDHKSRAVLTQMCNDEAKHGETAAAHGASALPYPVQAAMRLTSRIMIRTSYWV